MESLHLGNGVANMSFTSNLVLDICLFCARYDEFDYATKSKRHPAVYSLCFNLAEFAISFYNWKPFLALRDLIVVTLTDLLLLWYS